MSKQFKGQLQWVREVLAKYEGLEKFQPVPFNQEPEWPDWVSNLLAILLGISHPGLKIKSVRKWKAKDLGRLLGRQYAGMGLQHGQVPLSSKVIEEAFTCSTWAEERAKRSNPSFDAKRFQNQHERELKVWIPKFKRFIQETMVSACERPYVEASAFFEAFGKAIVIKPDDFVTERTMGVGDKICWTMFAMWPEISRLKSVADVHRVFEQALKPKGIVVKYKRIEKLCQRISLKFKAPGRPRGSKIQTNSISV